MAGAPGTNISRPRAKSAIQKTIMADETTSSVSKVSCLENDRKFALVSLLYSWYLTFGHQGCFLIKKSTAKSPRKRSAGLNCSRFEARDFKHTAHASFPCFQTTLKRLFIPRALLLSPSSSKHTHVHPSWQKCLKNSWEDGMSMLEICTVRERFNTVKFWKKAPPCISPSKYKPSHTPNSKSLPLNRPSKYRPPRGLLLGNRPQIQSTAKKNGKFPSRNKASPIDF